MDSSSGKRPADSEQTVDTFAVCSNCSRLSYNLKQCDKCGSALSEDHAAVCYSAEPKRPRTDGDSEQSATVVNGTSSASSSSRDQPDRRQSSDSPQPVPQALYMNKNAGARTSPVPNIRPQALYVNVNNQVFPVISVSNSESGSASSNTATASASRPAATVTHVTSSAPGGQLMSSIISNAVNQVSREVQPRGNGQAVPVGAAVPQQHQQQQQQQAGLSELHSSGGQAMAAVPPNAHGGPAMLSSAHSGLRMATPSAAHVAPPPLVPSQQSGPGLPASQNSAFSAFNLPPPAYPGGVVPRSSGSAVAANSTTGAPQTTAPATTGASGVPVCSIANDSITMPAYQIRIGTRKFIAASPVTFKEDGILFALKHYTFAPVLLNARAITRCKANMGQYPVFFVFLESTCMRQIRTIFNLSNEEFHDMSHVTCKRCITIFPQISAESRAMWSLVAEGVRRMFGSMGRRYPRAMAYLEEVASDQVIDMLFDWNQHASQPNGAPPATATAAAHAPPHSTQAPDSGHGNNSLHLQSTAGVTMVSGMGPAGGAGLNLASASRQPSQSRSVSVSASSRPPVSAMIRGSGYGQPAMTAFSQPSANMMTAPRGQASAAGRAAPTISTASTAPAQVTKNSKNTSGTTAPLLVVPNNPTRWREMQKELVVGGVYHVELPSKERKYYLWDGTQLVPCMVQNTEVQVNCVHVRVGSLRAEAVGYVKMKAENPGGISFTVKSDVSGSHDLTFPPSEIASCFVCFDRLCIMFLTLTWNGTWTLQSKLKLGNYNTDPCYNPSSTEERHKCIILVFKSVNKDQKEAMLQIKGSPTGPMIQEISLMQAVKNLHGVVRSFWNMQKGGSSHRSLPTSGDRLGLESMIKELAQIGGSGDKISEDDDDDDVIMTSEEIGIKCPYTQQVMKEPVRNKICDHNYEKAAIQEFIVRKKGNAKCPYAGCGNTKPLSMLDLEDNHQLKDYIRQQPNKSS